MKIKQVKALKALKPKQTQGLESFEGLFPNKMTDIEIKDERKDIKNFEEKINRKDLINKADKYKYDFQQYETIRSFGERYLY